MIPAPLPKNERERLVALEEYEILDTAAEDIFDSITWLASTICKTPISLITLVDKNRQWFKSDHGLGIKETKRNIAFCGHAILDSDLMEVTDASKDKRFHDNPLVTGEPKIRFYAGAPLINPQGYKLGTLCVIDRVPKTLSPTQKNILQQLSQIVIHIFELKKEIAADVKDRERMTEKLHKTNAALKSQLNEQKKYNNDIMLLSEMGSVLQSCFDLEEAKQSINQFCLKLFPEDSGILYLMDSIHYLERASFWGKPQLGEDLFSPDDCWALRRGQGHYVRDNKIDLVCRHLFGENEKIKNIKYTCLPLSALGDTFGLLCLQFQSYKNPADDEALAERKQLLLNAVAKQLALALANIKLRETLRYQSTCDPLTGLFNRRYLKEIFSKELRVSRYRAKPIAIIEVDIDHFKRFNDTFGHEAGDLVLQKVAGLLQKNIVSQHEYACRLGGEEFLLLLMPNNVDDIKLRAEKLRQEVAQLSIEYKGQRLDHVTVSLGMSLFPEHGATDEELISAADKALYQAKNNGRNQIALYAPDT